MKGVILAGGRGTRLHPVTKAVNKHLLPVYLHPMILYPLRTLVAAGITEIMIVTNQEHIADFKALLDDGTEYGCNITYGIQENPVGGLADGLAVAREFVGSDCVALILGDNVFLEDQAAIAEHAARTDFNGACLFLYEVEHPERFGVASIDENGLITKVAEKPAQPESNLAITGLYLYDSQVFTLIDQVEPSARGELEITDLNALYLQQGMLRAQITTGAWHDAGTFESLYAATTAVRNHTGTLLDSYTKERLAKGLKVDMNQIPYPLTLPNEQRYAA